MRTGDGVPSESTVKVLPELATTSLGVLSKRTKAKTLPLTSYNTAQRAVIEPPVAVQTGLLANDTVTDVVPAKVRVTVMPPVV